MDDFWDLDEDTSDSRDFWEPEYDNGVEDFVTEFNNDVEIISEPEFDDISENISGPEFDNDILENISEPKFDNDTVQDIVEDTFKNDAADDFSESEHDNNFIDFLEEADSENSDNNKSTDIAEKISIQIWNQMERDEKQARKKMPHVIAIQKKKLLIAINEITDKKLGEKDEEFMKSFKSMMLQVFGFQKMFKPQSMVWDDSKAKEKVHEILKKHAKFELSKYLEFAKIVLLAYSGKTEKFLKSVTDAMEYVLTHARVFGDTNKKIFHMDEILNEEETKLVSNSEATQVSLPSHEISNKIIEIIQELTKTYDENKFVILNVNTTYFTLLMLRRIVKNEKEFSNAFNNIQTHDNYVKLCPKPLGNQLPKCEFQICERNLVNCAYLAIETYLNTKDQKTKRILRATSILHMEFNGLQLPHLFFKVVKLYKIKAGELFDLLFKADSAYPVLRTCFDLADGYYTAHEKLKTGMTNVWFPFCRVLDGEYHIYLSAKENEEICTILACLVDLKMGFDKSTVRKAHWVKSLGTGIATAKLIHEQLNKNL